MDEASRRALLADPSARIERRVRKLVTVVACFDEAGPNAEEIVALRQIDTNLSSVPTARVATRLANTIEHPLGTFNLVDGQRMIRRAEEAGLRVEHEMSEQEELHIANAEGRLYLPNPHERRLLIEELRAAGVPTQDVE